MRTKLEALVEKVHVSDEIQIEKRYDALCIKQTGDVAKTIRVTLSRNGIINMQLEIGKDKYYCAQVTFDELFTALRMILEAKGATR